MKGVIVQIGEPKSIVLYNNGKIGAMPTPDGCHVGMVVTVKYNNKLKIIAIVLAAVLLLAIGIFIGARATGGTMPAHPYTPAADGGERRGRQIQNVTASQAITLHDDTLVILTGKITQSLGNEKYTFRDSTGEITVEIDNKLRRNLAVDKLADISDTVEISGEIDIEHGQVTVDVKSIKIK